MDLKSYSRWFDYSWARDEMLFATVTSWAPWHVVHSDSKRRARLSALAHILSKIPYEELPRAKESDLGKFFLAITVARLVTLVHRLILLMQPADPSALSRRKAGIHFCRGHRLSPSVAGFDMSDGASLPDESCE
jgi:hypothetical protein